jgi:hypothetical protein
VLVSAMNATGPVWVAVEMFDLGTSTRVVAVASDSPAGAVVAVFGGVGDTGLSLFEWCDVHEERGFLFTGFTTWSAARFPSVAAFESARSFDLSCVDPVLFEAVDDAPVHDRVVVPVREWWTLGREMRGVLWVAGTVSCVIHREVVWVSAPAVVAAALKGC